MSGQFLPIHSAVSRFVQATTRPGDGSIDAPRRPSCIPKCGVDGLCVIRIKCKFDRAGVRIFVKHPGPCLPSINRTKYASLFIWTESVAKRSDQNNVWILRINQDAPNLARIAQTNMSPRFSRIGGFVQAIAERNV